MDAHPGGPMLVSLVDIIILALTVLWWIIILQAILSWLIAFNVINTYNQGVRGFIRALDRMLEPLYRPIRKILPDFGGLDFSPLVILLVIMAIQRLLMGLRMDLMASYTA
jgi:YggT family protein